MPSKTNKQARAMAFAAHNPKAAKKAGLKIPQGVAQEFVKADSKTGRLKKAMRQAAKGGKRR